MAFDESLIQQPEDWDEETNGKWHPDPDTGKREWTMLVNLERTRIENHPLRSWRVGKPADSRRVTDEYLAWSGYYGLVETPMPEFDRATEKVIEADWVRDDVERTFTQAWDVVALDETEKAAVEERQWESLRRERNARLFESDWTQVADAPPDTKQGYRAYRQALRDLPENTDDPFNPVWPDEPSPRRRNI